MLLKRMVLVFLAVSLVLTFPNAVKKVNAQTPHILEVTCDQPYYYVKGNVMQIRAFSNITVDATINVYWNWRSFTENELIYSNTRTTNATWDLPTVNQKAGFYRIVVSTDEHTVTMWRTLIHYTGYVPESLPFYHFWKGVNYTLQGRSFKAETETDFIEVIYPKIPFGHTTSFYRNNMTFLIRLEAETWSVDLVYMTIHSGVKWAINGTLDNPQTFEFQCEHNPLKAWKRHLDTFKSESYLVFDWTDLKKAGKAFTWNSTTKTLSVAIPSSFSIDPEIFSDGFESGDFSAWTGTTTDAGCTATVNAVAHHGTKGAELVTDDAWERAQANAQFAGQTSLYARLYIKVPVITDTKQICFIQTWEKTAWNTLLRVYVKNDGGTYKWGIRWHDNGLQAFDWSLEQNPVAGNWYCVESFYKMEVGGGDDGEAHVYVEGAELSDLEHLNLDTGANDPVEVFMGVIADTAEPITVNIDCCVISNEYIDCEVAGQDVSFGLSQTIAFISSLTAGKELRHQFAETIQFGETSFFGLGKGFILSETVSILEGMTPAGLTQVVSFVLSETMKMLTDVSIPLTIIDEFFTALLFGSGAWLFLVVMLAIALLVTTVVKYGSLPFIFILMFLGVEYLQNVSQTSNFIYATIIAWGCIPLLIFIEARRKR